MNEMPKRVHMTLPDPVHDELAKLAEVRGQPIATVAAIVVELYLEQQKQSTQVPEQIKPPSKGVS